MILNFDPENQNRYDSHTVSCVQFMVEKKDDRKKDLPGAVIHHPRQLNSCGGNSCQNGCDCLSSPDVFVRY